MVSEAPRPRASIGLVAAVILPAVKMRPLGLAGKVGQLCMCVAISNFVFKVSCGAVRMAAMSMVKKDSRRRCDFGVYSCASAFVLDLGSSYFFSRAPYLPKSLTLCL